MSQKKSSTKIPSTRPNDHEKQPQLSKEYISQDDTSSDSDTSIPLIPANAEPAESKKSKSRESQKIPQTTFSSTSDGRPAPLYNPPSGFYAVQNFSGSAKLAKAFDSSKLSGKQLWHISLPAGTSIDALNGISTVDITKGDTIVGDESIKYKVTIDNNDNDKSAYRIMLPDEGGYVTAPIKIQKSICLQQLTDHPCTASIEPSKQKPFHIQPKGLRMRYRTSGAGIDYDGGAMGFSESDDSSQNVIPVLVKRKREIDDDDSNKKDVKEKKKSEEKSKEKKDKDKDKDKSKKKKDKKEKIKKKSTIKV